MPVADDENAIWYLLNQLNHTIYEGTVGDELINGKWGAVDIEICNLYLLCECSISSSMKY